MEINQNIFFCYWNHELRNVCGDEFILKMKDIGVTVLDNNNRVIGIDKRNINILGLSFFASKNDYRKP